MEIMKNGWAVCFIRKGKAVKVLVPNEKPSVRYDTAEWVEPVSVCDPVTHRSLGIDLGTCHVWRHPNGHLFAGTQLALTLLFNGKAAIEVLR